MRCNHLLGQPLHDHALIPNLWTFGGTKEVMFPRTTVAFITIGQPFSRHLECITYLEHFNFCHALKNSAATLHRDEYFQFLAVKPVCLVVDDDLGTHVKRHQNNALFASVLPFKDSNSVKRRKRAGVLCDLRGHTPSIGTNHLKM